MGRQQRPGVVRPDDLRGGEKDFDQAADTARKSQARPEVRQPLQRLLGEGKSAGAALERAVETDDRPGVARQVAQLAALQTRFTAWQRLGQSQQSQEGGGR